MELHLLIVLLLILYYEYKCPRMRRNIRAIHAVWSLRSRDCPLHYCGYAGDAVGQTGNRQGNRDREGAKWARIRSLGDAGAGRSPTKKTILIQNDKKEQDRRFTFFFVHLGLFHSELRCCRHAQRDPRSVTLAAAGCRTFLVVFASYSVYSVRRVSRLAATD